MFKTTIRFIKGYKKNTKICLLGIAFSVMLMYSLIQMGDCLMEKFKELATAGSVRDGSVKNINIEQAEQIVDGLENKKFSVPVEAYENIVSIGKVKMENEMISPYVMAIGGDWKKFMGVDIVEGKEPENPYEICMEKSFASKLGANIKIGDEIPFVIIMDGSGEEVKISFKLTGFINDTIAGSGTYYIVTPYQTAQDMIKKKTYKPGKESISIDILMPEEDGGLPPLLWDISGLLDINRKDFYKNYWQYNETKLEVYEEKGSFSSVSNTFKGLAVFIAVCMVIFVFNAIYINVTEKIKQYGAMRCIGLSKKQLFRMILYEGFVYAAVGIAAGLLLGNILNIIVAQKIIGFVYPVEGAIKLVQSPSTYLLTIGLALLSIAAAMAKILWNMRKLTPVQALNYTETDHFHMKIRDGGKPENSRSFVSLSAMRNIKRNLSKSVTLVITLTISTLLLMIIGNAAVSLDGSDRSGKEKIADFEIYSSTAEGKYISSDQIKLIESTDGVKEVYKEFLELEFQGELEELGEEKEPVEVLTIVYDNSLFKKLIEGHPELEQTDYKKPAAVLSVAPGFKVKEKEVTIKASKYVRKENKKAKKSTRVHLSGVIDSNAYVTGLLSDYVNRAYLIINEKMAEKMGVRRKIYSAVLVKAEDKSALNQSVWDERLNGTGLLCNDFSKGKEDASRQLLGMVMLALYIVVATLMLSLLIINNTIRANILIRSRENGITRALGMTAKQLRQTMVRENIILASWSCIISFLIAVPVNTYITYILWDRVQPHILICVLIAAFIILLCGFIAGRAVQKGMKQQIVDMIREE